MRGEETLGSNHTIDGVVMTPKRQKVHDALMLRKLAEVLDNVEKLSPSRAAKWAAHVREISDRTMRGGWRSRR